MKCPFCSSPSTAVLESRVVEGGETIRRRRQCDKCKKRFTTYEKARTFFLWVVKKDGRREPFDREKVLRGILRATEKRPVPLDKVKEIVDQVEREMLRKKKSEVVSKSIGRAIMKRLKRLDKVAWLRFASVYFEFGDISDFEKAIKDL